MSQQILQQGGILPLAEQCPDKATPLYAASYHGFGRTVVRLVAEQLVVAENLALASFDIAQEHSIPVGITLQRALGFPAWAIIQDPKNAQHALNLVGDLEWARRNAKNQPKKVKERFDALVVSLTASAPHFVPTLLEELSRIFDNAENTQYAKQYFSKAREIERNYNLEIDHERHLAVFIEFAVSGIVAAKELTNEANSALERFDDPKEAFEYLLEINTERVKARVEPYAYLVRDLRKVGKQAGLTGEEVDFRIFDAIFHLEKTSDAPAGFWKSVKTTLPKYLKSHAAAREIFRNNKPYEFGMQEYFQLLHATGCIEEVRQDPHKHAAWIIHTINEIGYRGVDRENGYLQEEVILAADHLQDRCVNIDTHCIPPSLIDRLLEYNVEFTKPQDTYWRGLADWSAWFVNENEQYRRDLTFLAQSKVFRASMVEWLKPEMISDHLDLLLAHAGARDLLFAKLDVLAEERQKCVGSIPNTNKFLDVVAPLTLPKLRDVAPEQMAKIFAIDPVHEVQEVIRRGTLAEYSWPAFEDAYHRCCAQQGNDCEVLESYPAVAIRSGSQIELVDGDRTIFSGTVPADCEKIDAVQHIDNDVMIVYRPKNNWQRQVYWLGSSAASPGGYGYSNCDDISLPVAGGRLTASGLLTPGVQTMSEFNGKVFTTAIDGNPAALMRGRWYGLQLWNGQTVSPASGETREVLHALGFDSLGLDCSEVPDSAEVDFYESLLIPAQPTTQQSPFGAANGVHTSIYFEGRGSSNYIVSPLGTFTVRETKATALRRPGGGVWLMRECVLFDVETETKIACAHDYFGTKLSIEKLPTACWHQLRPRDENASIAMRNYQRDQAAVVVADFFELDTAHQSDENSDVISAMKQLFSAIAEIQRIAGTGVDPELQHALDATSGTTERVIKILGSQLGTQNAVLLKNLAEQIYEVREIYRRFVSCDVASQTQPESDKNSAVEVPNVITQGGLNTLRRLTGNDCDATCETISQQMHQLGAFHNNPTQPLTEWLNNECLSWLDIAGNERYVFASLGAPYVPQLYGTENVRDVISFLRHAIQQGILGTNWRKVAIEIPKVNREKVAELFPANTIVDGCLVLGDKHCWLDGSWVTMCILWAPDDRATIAGYKVRPYDHYPLRAELLSSALDELESNLENRQLSETTISAISDGTALTNNAVKCLFGRKVPFHSYDRDFLNTEQRNVLGLKAADMKAAMIQCSMWRKLGKQLVTAGVDSTNPSRYVTEGPDVEAVLQCWKQEVPEHVIVLSDAEIVNLQSSIDVTRKLYQPAHMLTIDDSMGSAVSLGLLDNLLYLATTRKLNDPCRPEIAKKLEVLRDAWVEKTNASKKYQELAAKYPLGSEYSVVEYTDISYLGLQVLLGGHLDALIDDLKHVYEVSGCSQDPLVSAPEIVAEVATELHVSENAARYFLQLLAMPYPSDKNIREWNGWRKQHIDQAATELLDHGFILEAKRVGAGRTRFIHGGWVPGRGGSKPVEAWKIPHYFVWRDSSMRPVLSGNPLTVPAKQLFESVWRRYMSGDAPGYEEVVTTRYRKRR